METQAVVVLGASGFIGRNVVDAMQGKVPLVYGVTGRPQVVPGCTQSVTLDAIDTLPALPPQTVVVNTAAARYDARTFRAEQPTILATNTAIVNRAYAFCVARGLTEVRFTSSAAVYPASWSVQDDDRVLDLNDWPHDGESAYAWSKRWGEIAAESFRRTHGISTLSFRLTNPFGPYDTLDREVAHVATAFVLKAVAPGDVFEVLGNPAAERDFVYAGDIAAVIAATLDTRGMTETANIARGTTTTVLALAEGVLAAAGSSKRIDVAPVPPSGVNIRRATGQRLHRLFPQAPALCSLDDGLRQTIRWYRDAQQHH